MEKVRVVAAVIVHEGKFLGVKRSAQAKTNPNRWEFPGGKIEYGETIHQAILREVKEEIAIDVLIKQTLLETHWQEFMREFYLTYVLCVPKAGFKIILLEHVEYGWFSSHDFETKSWLPGDDQIPFNLKNSNIIG
jgi:8-oxo-dGTP diphosphatase